MTGHAVGGGGVAFALAAADDAYAVRARLSVVAQERHLAIPHDVVDTPVLKRLRPRPHLRAVYDAVEKYTTHAS